MAYHGENPNFKSTILDDKGVAAVSNAPTGKVRLINRSKNIFIQDDAGVEIQLGASQDTEDDSTEAGSVTVLTGKRRYESGYEILVGDTWTVQAGARLVVEESLVVTGTLIATGVCRTF